MAKKKRFQIPGTKIKSFNELIVGDWIFMKMEDGFVYKGFMTRIDQYDEGKARFIGYYDFEGKWHNDARHYTVTTYSSSYKVFKEKDYTLNDYDYEAKRHLIDLTLMTNDVEWFKELTN